MEILQQLVQLSEIRILDCKLRELREKEAMLPAKANAAKKKIEEFASRLKNLDSKHAEILVNRRKLDVDLQGERNNLRKWESRADQIRGDREYAALMSEIGSLKRSISNIETKIIDDMQSLEELEKEIAQLNAKSAVVTKEAEEEFEAVKAQLSEVSESISKLDSSKDALLGTLPGVISRRYKMISGKRAGMAIALVKNEVCQACSRTIPAELFNRVLKAEVVEQCPNCNRLLVTESLSHIEHVG